MSGPNNDVNRRAEPFDDQGPIEEDFLLNLLAYPNLDRLLDVLEVRTRAMIYRAPARSPTPWLRALLDEVQHIQHILWMSRLHRNALGMLERDEQRLMRRHGGRDNLADVAEADGEEDENEADETASTETDEEAQEIEVQEELLI